VKMKLISRGPACLMFTLFVAMTGAALAGSPVPLVNQPLVPDAVAPGGAAFVLTLNGSGFVSGSVVRWNGSALATTFVSGSQLKASVPASDVLQPGTASVTVVNPGPGGGTCPKSPERTLTPERTRFGDSSRSRSVMKG
jgi:hypothetical protein